MKKLKIIKIIYYLFFGAIIKNFGVTEKNLDVCLLKKILALTVYNFINIVFIKFLSF
jgi:hypothetical protein